MKIKTLILVVLFTFSTAFFSFATEKDSRSLQIDYSAGLNLSYNSVPILLGDSEIENTLKFSYMALELDLGIHDYLTVGVVAGFNSNKLSDPVDFTGLPLSLRLDDKSFNSMLLGLRAKSEFFSWNNFAFEAGAEFLYFKENTKDLDIQLPIVSGQATAKNSFTQTALELLIKYEGFSNFTVFAGPQLSLLKGTVTASETLGVLSGEQDLDFDQEKSFGFVGGARFELGSNFDLNVKASLFSRTSLSVEIFYVF
jgi:hypothetical protein